jgi:hypothetical protein
MGRGANDARPRGCQPLRHGGAPDGVASGGPGRLASSASVRSLALLRSGRGAEREALSGSGTGLPSDGWSLVAIMPVASADELAYDFCESLPPGSDDDSITRLAGLRRFIL